MDAVRAEAFNSRTLFLFGSYTIGKERLFLEVARQLEMKALPPLPDRSPAPTASLRACRPGTWWCSASPTFWSAGMDLF